MNPPDRAEEAAREEYKARALERYQRIWYGLYNASYSVTMASRSHSSRLRARRIIARHVYQAVRVYP